MSDTASSTSIETSEVAKRQLRRAMRLRRRALSPAARRAAAQRLLRALLRQRWFRQARTIALYRAADGEIDPAPLLWRALAMGKQVYLPVLRRGGALAFGEYRRGARLRRNRYGIAEPAGAARRAPQQLDLVLLPLVAFDRSGGRLGMGGGFYDRTFAFLRGGIRRLPRLVGLAHHFQELPRVPREPWDVGLSAVVTERGPVRLRGR